MSELKPLLALGALALLGSVAHAGESEAQKFNNALAGFNKQLSAAGRSFGEAIGPGLKGEEVNLPQLRKTYMGVLKALAKVQKELAAQNVPDSESARKLAKVYQQFLKGQERVIKKELSQVVRLVEGNNPPDQQTRDQIQKLLLEIAERERGDLAELQAAQRAFAEAHGIKLRQPEP